MSCAPPYKLLFCNLTEIIQCFVNIFSDFLFRNFVVVVQDFLSVGPL